MTFPGEIIKDHLPTSNAELTNRPTERTLSKSLLVERSSATRAPRSSLMQVYHANAPTTA